MAAIVSNLILLVQFKLDEKGSFNSDMKKVTDGFNNVNSYVKNRTGESYANRGRIGRISNGSWGGND